MCGVAAALLFAPAPSRPSRWRRWIRRWWRWWRWIRRWRRGFGGGGGGGGFGGGGGGGQFNFQQMQMQRYQTALNITNDDEWAAIQPLIQKVVDARTALGTGMGRRGSDRRTRGGGGERMPHRPIQKGTPCKMPLILTHTRQSNKGSAGKISEFTKNQASQTARGGGQPPQSAYCNTGGRGDFVGIAGLGSQHTTEKLTFPFYD